MGTFKEKRLGYEANFNYTFLFIGFDIHYI